MEAASSITQAPVEYIIIIGQHKMNPQHYLTIEQAAERAQVSRNTVKLWIKQGMPIIVLSKRLKRIPVDIFDGWLLRKIEGDMSFQGGSTSALTESQLIEKIVKNQR